METGGSRLLMSQDVATIRVTRYRPEKDGKPYFQDYKVPYRKDMVVLDALNYIKANLDGTLTYRWSCRMGVCGSCGANVDGVPKLTCASFLHEFKGRTIKVEPLTHFPVIKDLVVNMDDFMHKLVEIKPWIIRRKSLPRKRVSTVRALRNWKGTTSSPHASTACSATPPARSTGSTRNSWVQRLRLLPTGTSRIPETRGRMSGFRSCMSSKEFGSALW